jgi:hypothetical protein
MKDYIMFKVIVIYGSLFHSTFFQNFVHDLSSLILISDLAFHYVRCRENEARLLLLITVLIAPTTPS